MMAWPAALLDGSAGRPALLAGFGAGVLAATGQAPLGWWPLALLGFAGLLALLLPVIRPWRAARLLWVGAGGYFAASLHWIVEPFLVDLARHGWMAPFALVLLAFGLALFWGAAAGLAAWLTRPGRGRALALVLTLSAAELLRSYIFTGFPWAAIGHLWIGTPVLQWAALGGPVLLSLLALGLVALPLGWGRRGLARALLGLALLWGWGSWQQGQPIPARADPVSLRLIQPNAAQHLKWQPDKIPEFLQRQLTLSAEPGAPDLIVWPETSVAYLLDSAGPVLREMGRVAGVPVIFGVQRRAGDRVYNSAAMIDADGALLQRYDKHHLVPFGEYIPFADLAARLGLRGLAQQMGSGYAAGPGPQVWDLGALGQVLPLICYEMIFPQDLRTPTRPDWVLQLTNDAWFGNLSGPYQHLAQSRLRAVEQGLPVLRSANTGVSAVIDARGQLLHSLALSQSGQLTAPLPGALPAPLYARSGDWPWALLLALGLSALIWRRFSG